MERSRNHLEQCAELKIILEKIKTINDVHKRLEFGPDFSESRRELNHLRERMLGFKQFGA